MTPTERGEMDSAATRTLDLAVEGMTCASCATRVERKLNRLPGATATVNLATERARVELPAGASDDDALAAVAAAGYRGRVTTRPFAAQAASDHLAPRLAVQPEAPAGLIGKAGSAPDHAAAGDAPHDHASHDHGTASALRQRVIVSAVLAAPVFVLSMVPPLQFANWQWLAFALASPVAVWGAWPFHRTAFQQARHLGVGMDSLISIGVAAAYLWSVWALFFGTAGMPGMHMRLELIGRPGAGSDDLYLEVASVVTVFLLAGRYFEARARTSSGAALHTLLELGAKDASRLVDGREERVAASALAVGDLFVVRPGEKVATDGVVVEGTSAIDAALLTGEPVPVEVGPGSAVTGGTIDVGGRLVVRATRVGADTQLAHIARLVEDAQTGKAQVQRLADRISGIFVPIVIGLALATFVGWLVTGHAADLAITAAVATIIIACPCALGLATPTALLVGTGRGATRGILIRGPEVLERAGKVDTIVLDKTGTLTTGSMSVAGVTAARGVEPTEVLARAAAVEAGSEHPVGRALVAAWQGRGMGADGDTRAVRGSEEGFGRSGTLMPVLEDFHSTGGLGVQGLVDGTLVVAGRVTWLEDNWSLAVDETLRREIDEAESTGSTLVAVGWDGLVRGFVALTDTLRPDAVETLTRLRALGLEPVLLTGDNARVASVVAGSLGIERVVAGVLPEGKLATVRALQAEGRVVAMVGDGVNDAAALAGADLGIAVGAGTDAAIEASDITLVRDDLLLVPEAVTLSRRTLRIIKTNLFWAFAYNVAALPIAMLGLLSPVVSGLAMALSSLVVVGNSLRLKNEANVKRGSGPVARS